MSQTTFKQHALVRMHGRSAGYLKEYNDGHFVFEYRVDYDGPPVSLTMPVRAEPYTFDRFPPFFDGLLPEGWLLDMLLRRTKIERNDYLEQLLIVGGDLVGAVTVEAVREESHE